jgi:hypothetical protein
MILNSFVAIATFPTSNDAGGCRLVARLNFRRSESEVARYAGAGTARGKIRSGEDTTRVNAPWHDRHVGFSHALCYL